MTKETFMIEEISKDIVLLLMEEHGMSMDEAMATWKTIDQVPSEFIPVKKPRINKKTGQVIVQKDNILDKIYKKIFTRRENIINEPSVNAVPIPEQYVVHESAEDISAAVEGSASLSEETSDNENK